MLTTIGQEISVSAVHTQQIRSFIVDNFLLGRDSGFDNDESLLESGIIDSTGIMHVVAFLEEQFGITIEDEDLVADNLDSVARIARFVGSKQLLRDAA
ncbi:acyl carrier protein [Azospirillum fermentarium]|uniref:acyl carrier protein n=1 Tax=Azospirillum fermentarium TaxID=1233114 RepID=UPI0022269DCC|nr:acyl carrier protein [Azospirillum fermentarium]MCW2247475.1 acyl carrier protein [Azospirillum fermentarium]